MKLSDAPEKTPSDRGSIPVDNTDWQMEHSGKACNDDTV
jgi:hypothetical protein